MRLCLLQGHEADRRRSQAEPERDEWRLRPEDEAERERREGCQEDSGQLDEADLSHPEPLERRVPTVTRQAERSSHQETADGGDEDHVPRGGLAPAEPVGHHVPDHVRGVVDRGLEQAGCEGDRDAQESRQDERAQIGPGTRVHAETLLALRDDRRARGGRGFQPFGCASSL